MLASINLAISTVCRKENYLAATLESLLATSSSADSQRVCLVAGSPVTTHLEGHRSHPKFTVVEIGPNTWAWIKNSSLRHRATWNYYRCLTQCPAGARGTLIFEDDVRFAHGWQVYLIRILAALEERYGADFVLSLYTSWGFVQEGYRNGQMFTEYPHEDFFGTQGMYFTAKTRQGFAKYLKAHGVVANEEAYDLLLRDYLRQVGLPLFATAPSLVQHVGKRSTGLGGWHESPAFVEDVTGEASRLVAATATQPL